MTAHLPERLHNAHAWTEAAGELEELRDLSGDELAEYCRESAENSDSCAEDTGELAVTVGELEDLHEWLNNRRVMG